ncbi:CrpP family protein, partial [Pseudomonas aeruginosa]|nr:CrpP family protein [Pseudomonas aeruginosa]EKU3814708.1 CrpP family protein [Pseudomonas aeruginosa]EKU5894765.1 CrpP family protein [Pseudomonas aeruginosa]EKU5911147.1 CrpP family protein [Pseudomonas aeruginosa]EKV9174752.1 CrpP family protein [Pseudomonas aeruginosa]
MDRRHFNDPHRTVRAIGAEAARKGLRVFDCPYSHPAMRASWLKGFAQEQQQQRGCAEFCVTGVRVT